jgi:hypothetical protein
MVLLDLSREQYFALNPVAARMWLLLASGETVDTITAELLEEYEVAPDVLRADVLWFARRIVELGFVSCATWR